MEKLRKLADEARIRLAGNPEADQVVVLETAAGTHLILENHNVLMDDSADEAAFLTGLGKTQVTRLVCMWQGQFLDVPSQHLREGLKKANPGNKEAQVLLRGERGLCSRALKDLQ